MSRMSLLIRYLPGDRRLSASLAGIFISLFAGSQPSGAQVPTGSSPLVFDHVTVIDVQDGHQLPDQRVVILGNRLRAVGSASTVRLPAQANVIDAHGKYLIPGLWDMHVHFNDQTTQQVDFAPFLAGSHNPLIPQYFDPVRFAAFTVRDGDLVWDDYALCFPVADLYDNTL